MKLYKSLLIAALTIFSQANFADAQTANGKATTAAPTYTNGSSAPLSLDTVGNLRINCITGCSGAGNSNAQATTAAPSYTNATSNPLSMDLSGNLRTVVPGGVSVTGGSVSLLSGSAIVGKVGIDQTTPGTTNGVQINAALPSGANAIGTVGVTAGSSIIGKVGIDQTTPGTTNAVQVIGSLPAGSSTIGNVGSVPLATPSTTNFSLVAAASTNSTSVKASAGALFEVSTYNNSANIAYLKFYDSASAPTCGSGTPVARYLIPGASSGGAGSNVNISLGKGFSTGIAFCVTGGIADTDTTAVAASAFLINLTYK